MREPLYEHFFHENKQKRLFKQRLHHGYERKGADQPHYAGGVSPSPKGDIIG